MTNVQAVTMIIALLALVVSLLALSRGNSSHVTVSLPEDQFRAIAEHLKWIGDVLESLMDDGTNNHPVKARLRVGIEPYSPLAKDRGRDRS